MTRIKSSFILVLLTLSVLWVLADPVLFSGSEFSSLRLSLLNGSGILAIGVMSIAMILATRIVSISAWLGGLDKSYRLHKWVGIAGLVLGFIH